MADATPKNDGERLAHLLGCIPRVMHRMKPPRVRSLAYDLTIAQGHCLREIAHSEGCTMRELSRRLGVSPSTACELVDRLVQAGLVERELSYEDRRVVHLRLASKGRRFHAKMRSELGRHMQSFLDCMTPDLRRRMFAALEELNEIMQLVARDVQPPAPHGKDRKG